jgi:DNA-binding NarL/FixJ family response regulator
MSRAELSVVVADDHPAVVDSLSRFLAHAGFQIVATARDGETALEALLEHRPRILVTDIRMPRVDGLELLQRIHREDLDTAVVLYSGFAARALAAEALGAGAAAFVLKDAPLEELARAIDTVAAGERWIDAVLLADLVETKQTLSERELQVIRLLADGLAYREIAERLFLSPDTIRSHVQHLLSKLGAHTRSQAVATALRRELIS